MKSIQRKILLFSNITKVRVDRERKELLEKVFCMSFTRLTL